jgi:aminotransferase in exopolysaccharide biosynthesis
MDTDKLNNYIRSIYGEQNDVVPLHAPVFLGNERKYVGDTIDSTFVSSVGQYVTRVEEFCENYAKVKKTVAVVNGTSALQVALRVVGVERNTEVLTQALTFVATVNAISLNGACPVFIDVNKETMGLSPEALERFLNEYAEIEDNGSVINRVSKRRISAVLPMHTFGFLCKMDELKRICAKWNLPIVEDAAEAMGSFVNGFSAGSLGTIGVFSFNGNKIITSGGGGLLLTNDSGLGLRAKHLTTTAKIPHQYEFFHDEVAFNYRMPNLNAALLLGQLESLERIKKAKSQLYYHYKESAEKLGIDIVDVPLSTTDWNFWLISAKFKSRKERNEFLVGTNEKGIMTRPIWQLMYRLPMYSHCQRDSQENAEYLEDTIVNLPSSPPKTFL